MTAVQIYVPGACICASEDHFVLGEGVYSRNGNIYASLAGYLKKKVSDLSVKLSIMTPSQTSNTLPAVGDLVICKVLTTNTRQCVCNIIAIEKQKLRQPYRGVVRQVDIRATDVDKVLVHQSFRPGDVIIARVLSFGDERSYILTTAENELGVVVATSEAGAPLIPLSWCEMLCTQTAKKELRKVAKVQKELVETMLKTSSTAAILTNGTATPPFPTADDVL